VNDGAPLVLQSLRESDGRACSGGALAERLGVSRAQVWKHVEALRKRGYEIEGTPGGGYRLAAVPDRLYPEEIQAGLATRWLGREVLWLEETDSTNRVAGERARAGAPHGLAVVAEGQTAGRGRLGRAFFSPPHVNLYTSIVLRPRIALAAAPTVILATGAAVAEVVAEEVGDPAAVEVKWPNDVLLGGRKTSGILMELVAEATQVGHLVLGIGVNLNVDRELFPEEFRAGATSLASYLGRRVDRAAFVRRLFVTLEDMLDLHAERGFAALRPRFDRFYRMAGRAVTVSEPGGTRLEGEALEPDADGALAVRRADGSVVRVLAGDVTLSPLGGAAR